MFLLQNSVLIYYVLFNENQKNFYQTKWMNGFRILKELESFEHPRIV